MLETLLGSRLRARVLGWLLGHPDERCFVRQLAGILHEDSTNLSRELARLARLGILRVEAEGRQKYYRADTSCPAYTELRGLALKTTGAAGQIRATLEPLAPRIRVAFLYGSVARGDERADSDIDLIVVGDVTFAEMVRALQPVQESTAREVNPTVYSASEYAQKLRTGHHFVTAVSKEPKIFVKGGPDELERVGAGRLARRPSGHEAGNRRPARRR